jgi:L-threonylcarbamoyladenylate synthase
LPTTRVLGIDRRQPDARLLREAALVLSGGGLVAFATETVYGLGAVAINPAAVARIFKAKGRPSFNPLIVHVQGVGEAKLCTTQWPEAAGRLARQFWPGPLTLVLPRSTLIPDLVTAGRETVALRVPASSVALGLIEHAGQPLAAPSANRSNGVSPTRAEHVLADLDGRIDLILDSGRTDLGLESTVVDLTESPLRVLRPGPVTAEQITLCLDRLHRVEALAAEPTESNRPASPGMLPLHYAPATPAWRIEDAAELTRLELPARSAIVVFGPAILPKIDPAIHQSHMPEPIRAGRDLYLTLRQLDALGLEQIVVVMPPDQPDWAAIRDRLSRATRPASP